MKIIPAKKEYAPRISFIVREANKDVAELFKLNRENAPKHPSFYTEDWVLSDFRRGEDYFLYMEDGIIKGCVAWEQPAPDTAYLNRLSVLPNYRHKGYWCRLG